MPAVPRRILKIAADVATRAESFSRPRKNHHPNLIVVARIGQRAENLVNHRLRIRVSLRWTIQRNRRNVGILLIEDLAHALAPSVDIPPSTTSDSPVVLFAIAAKNSAASATSSTDANCRSGVIFSAASNDSLGHPANRVRTNPDSTTFTRIPGASALASDFVIVTTPAFDAAYAIELPCPVIDATDEMFTIDEPSCFLRNGVAARTQ